MSQPIKYESRFQFIKQNGEWRVCGVPLKGWPGDCQSKSFKPLGGTGHRYVCWSCGAETEIPSCTLLEATRSGIQVQEVIG